MEADKQMLLLLGTLFHFTFRTLLQKYAFDLTVKWLNTKFREGMCIETQLIND